jgi:DNA repair photolyase
MIYLRGKVIMGMVIKEKSGRSILSKSGISGIDYCINPYAGCSHGCRYCYATFMKRFTGHREPWGSFVDVKMNAPALLQKQIGRVSRGNVLISSVTDPYQPIEARYRLTRQCLEVLLPHSFSVDILTKSPLVLRDLDLLGKFKKIEVGVTITTDDEEIRRVFEPHAPPVQARIQALRKLYEEGIKTYAFIGPLLPMNPERLAEEIRSSVHSVLIDRLNYASKVRKIYALKNLHQWLDYDFVEEMIQRLELGFAGKAVYIC